MCSAIHINYRSWLRSSSTHEPSDPPHRIILLLGFERRRGQLPTCFHAESPRERHCEYCKRRGVHLRIPTRRRRRQQSERGNRRRAKKCHLRASQELTNDRDERSCEDGHPRDPYTARRLFNSLPLPREGKTKRKGRRVPGRMLA